MSDDKPYAVHDIAEFFQLVEAGRVGVEWTVYSDIGPDCIGSRREITFYVESRPVPGNATISRLVKLLVDGLQIPATSSEYMIRGEGELRKSGNTIELDYDWYKVIPYDNPIECEGGVLRLVQIDES